jgi:hypothetical protein
MHGIIQDKTYIKKEKESDKLRLGGGAWTLNLSEISGKQIEKIQYITDKFTYSINYNDAVKKGFIRQFQGELKLIIPIRCWEITK